LFALTFIHLKPILLTMAPRRRRPQIGKTGCLFWFFILLVIIVIFVYKGKGNLKDSFSFLRLKNIRESMSREKEEKSAPTKTAQPEKPLTKEAVKEDDTSSQIVTREKGERAEKPVETEKSQTSEKTAPGGVVATKEKASSKPEIQLKKLNTSLYFVKISSDGNSVKPVSVTRTIEYRDSPITRTIESLLQGPTMAERQNGIISFIPEGTKLISARILDGHLTLNFTKEFEENYTGREAILLELSQVLFTSFNFSQVKKISVLIEGNQKRYITGEGIPLKQLYTQEDLAELTQPQR